jgi:hypothetical protein
MDRKAVLGIERADYMEIAIPDKSLFRPNKRATSLAGRPK